MFILFLFFFGLAAGSFLNVVIHRLQTGEPIIIERSHCPKCRNILRWFDLVPLFSFFQLGGKCRYCGKKISVQYPLVELATALLFVWVFIWQYPQFSQFKLDLSAPYLLDLHFFSFLYYLIIISILIVIFVYDLKHYLILNKVIYPAIVLALAYNTFMSIEQKGFSPEAVALMVNGWLAALLASGFFLALVLASRGKWMGIGDIKLAFFMGFVLGWPQILAALFLAFLSGAAVGIVLIILKKKGLKSELPFGPFLAGATILVLFYSHILTDWFFGFMMC